jgi:NADPH2:quinone reductase
MKEFILYKQGDPKNLKLENMSGSLTPRKDEVLIRHSAIGINYFDIHFRNGDYEISKMPTILGQEACGYIEAVGNNVNDYKPGDRVAYATGPMGAYTQKRIIKRDFLVRVPSEISDAVAAGSLRKGLMAHTLLNRVYIASRSKRILVHAASGGVGQFLCAFARDMGIEVIGTVGHDKKIPFAKKFGCNHVINYKRHDFVKEIERLTKGSGVGVVYDGVGKDTILKSMACLWPMGMCVSYGEVSGKIPPIDINHLLLNSLYLTKPLLALYKSSRVELAIGASEVFDKIKNGVINPKVTTHKFEDLPNVHKQIQKRATVGSQVLLLDSK